MDNKKLVEKLTLKDILGSFIVSYTERNKDKEFLGWLENKLQQEMPGMSEEASEKLASEIVEAVAVYDKTLDELNMAIDAGHSKEEWLAGHLSETYADMPLKSVGDKLQEIENGFIVSNMQLMQEVDETQAEAGEVSVVNNNSIEWNKYNIKDKAYEIGKQISLSGVAAAANVLKEKAQSDEVVAISGIVRETLQDDLKRDSREVKAVVAGAVKAAAEKGVADIIPEDIPTDVISNIAGAAVESTEALFDVMNEKSSMTEAMDKISRASIAAAGHCVSSVLEEGLSKVPHIGPVLVDLAGGLFDHLASSTFVDNMHNVVRSMYTVARDTAVATWKGIKKSFIGRGVKVIANGLKKLVN